MRWHSFVAVGDSFTEGLDDPHPAGRGYRGWADLVATRLAYESSSPFRYANLAVRGRLFDAIVAEQVPPALAMGADLVSFAGGGNDVLRRHFDPAPMLARFDDVVSRFRASGADVLLFRFADMSAHLPGARLIAPRTRLLNEAVGEVAARHGAILIDLSRDQGFTNRRLWSEDRLHLSSTGHRRVAARVLAALGLDTEPDWLAVPAAPVPGFVTARVDDARWAARHLVPWLRRRLTGRSSGDTVTAKRPVLTTVVD